MMRQTEKTTEKSSTSPVTMASGCNGRKGHAGGQHVCFMRPDPAAPVRGILCLPDIRTIEHGMGRGLASRPGRHTAPVCACGCASSVKPATRTPYPAFRNPQPLFSSRSPLALHCRFHSPFHNLAGGWAALFRPSTRPHCVRVCSLRLPAVLRGVLASSAVSQPCQPASQRAVSPPHAAMPRQLTDPRLPSASPTRR